MIEQTILSGIITDEEYSRKVMPHLKEEYFRQDGQRITFKLIESYINKYNRLPTRDAVALDLSNLKGLGQSDFDDAVRVVEALTPPDVDYQWLIDNTETFCLDKGLFNALNTAIQIADGDDKGVGRGAIPKLLEDALAISFDTAIGHDFMDDAEERFAYYHEKGDKIPFSMESFNDRTRGGFERKTLNIFLGGTNVGKSLVMCSMAADYLMKGYNVLYITMEMAEKKIAQRIDANLLDTPMDGLVDLTADAFQKKLARVREKQPGRLVVKEFPTASAHVGHFRHTVNELRTKKNFRADVIFIDYLNICASSRVRAGGGDANSYNIVKSIAEELRGFFVEQNAVGITATQTNRSGFNDSDVDLTSTSESFGVPMTADWMGAIVSNDELAELNQYMVIQLKSRYDDINRAKKFMVGVDRPKMRLYDVQASVYAGKPDDPKKGAAKAQFDRRPSAKPPKPEADDPPPWQTPRRASTREFNFDSE